MRKKAIKEKPTEKYFEATGRRKTSVARVRVIPAAQSGFVVNGKDARGYFQTEEQRRLILDPMIKGTAGTDKTHHKWQVEAKISGGGTHSQAEALRHGLSRTLALFDPELRPKLKGLGYLKRDSRAKERRKFGLKKARKAPKWSKR